MYIGKDGITLRSEMPGGAKIDPPSGKIGINIGADHVTVKGFEVSGSTTAASSATVSITSRFSTTSFMTTSRTASC